MSSAGRLLAVDYGERRIGLAVSDSLGTIATPLDPLERRPGKRVPVARLVRLASELSVTGFVVGLPLDGEGNDLPRAADVRTLAAQLEERTGLPVQLVDERYTTAAALRRVREMGGSTFGRRGDIDSLSAAVLLQGVLNAAK
jgi:putative holliday junction resolvase